MTRHAERLIEAREEAHPSLRGTDFDAWLLPVILDALEPRQRDMMELLLTGQSDEPLATSDICGTMCSTPWRAGLTLSRLRRIGLVKTTYRIEAGNRRAYHVAVDWVRQANKRMIEQDRALWATVLRTIG